MNKWEKLRTFGTTIYIDIDTGEILKDWNNLKEYYRKIEFWETKEIKEERVPEQEKKSGKPDLRAKAVLTSVLVYTEESKSKRFLPCFAERGLFVSVDVRLSTISEMFSF